MDISKEIYRHQAVAEDLQNIIAVQLTDLSTSVKSFASNMTEASSKMCNYFERIIMCTKDCSEYVARKDKELLRKQNITNSSDNSPEPTSGTSSPFKEQSSGLKRNLDITTTNSPVIQGKSKEKLKACLDVLVPDDHAEIKGPKLNGHKIQNKNSELQENNGLSSSSNKRKLLGDGVCRKSARLASHAPEYFQIKPAVVLMEEFNKEDLLSCHSNHLSKSSSRKAKKSQLENGDASVSLTKKDEVSGKHNVGDTLDNLPDLTNGTVSPSDKQESSGLKANLATTSSPIHSKILGKGNQKVKVCLDVLVPDDHDELKGAKLNCDKIRNKDSNNSELQVHIDPPSLSKKRRRLPADGTHRKSTRLASHPPGYFQTKREVVIFYTEMRGRKLAQLLS